ncbi:MAG: hypothetical protein ACRC1M_08645, partial [Methanobacteriaceae archaeon]
MESLIGSIIISTAFILCVYYFTKSGKRFISILGYNFELDDNENTKKIINSNILTSFIKNHNIITIIIVYILIYLLIYYSSNIPVYTVFQIIIATIALSLSLTVVTLNYARLRAYAKVKENLDEILFDATKRFFLSSLFIILVLILFGISSALITEYSIEATNSPFLSLKTLILTISNIFSLLSIISAVATFRLFIEAFIITISRIININKIFKPSFADESSTSEKEEDPNKEGKEKEEESSEKVAKIQNINKLLK